MSFGNVATLLGKTLINVHNNVSDEVHFETSDGEHYKLHHPQDCCEYVYLESIVGDLEDLIGSPILIAEERSKYEECDYGDQMWTFYELATNKGSVTLRFNGSSNGYYSISVDFEKVS